jgi:hypothetical protein
MNLNDATPFIAGPIIGVLSLILAYLAYKRGSRADDNAQENAAIAQVYTGYGDLLKQFRDDNAELRRRLDVAEARIVSLEGQIQDHYRG